MKEDLIGKVLELHATLLKEKGDYYLTQNLLREEMAKLMGVNLSEPDNEDTK